MLGLLRARGGWRSTDSASGILGVVDSEAAGLGEDAPEMPGRIIPGGQRLVRLIMLVIVCSYFSVIVLEQVSGQFSSRSLVLGVGLPSLAVLLVLTVWITSAAVAHWSPRRRLAMLLAQGLVTYLPILVLGTVWADLSGFFAGAALLLLSGWVAWAVFGAAIGSMLAGGVIGAAVESEFAWSEAAYLTITTLVLGLVVFGLSRLSLLTRYVHARRDELAQLAVASERMRFTRDLNGLLGSSLSAITLKAELTRRLVGSNPARARDELAELLDIARQALADVRIVATGYRNISLANEAGSVAALLKEAGIEVRVAIGCPGLEESVDSLLAAVLREAVANLLSHSTARNCVIEAGTDGDTVRLRIANDGVPRSARSGHSGGGLENLSSRLAAVGGSLTGQVRADGWFEVLAEAPRGRTADQPDRNAERPQKAGA